MGAFQGCPTWVPYVGALSAAYATEGPLFLDSLQKLYQPIVTSYCGMWGSAMLLKSHNDLIIIAVIGLVNIDA